MEKLTQSNQELLNENRLLKQRIQQLEQSKEKRADELVIANDELTFQNEEKEKRADELVIVNDEIAERKRIEDELLNVSALHAETERIGKVGGWQFDIDSLKQIWTEEVCRIHEVDFPYESHVEDGVNFYTPSSRPLIERAVQRAIEFGEPFDLELDIITGKGNLRNIHAIGKADLEHRKILGFFQDITERKQAEQHKQVRYHMLELLANNETLPVILDTIVRGMEQLLPEALCSILLLDKEGLHLEKGIAPSLPDFYNAALDGIEIGIGVGSCGTAAFTGELVVVDDIATHPYWAPYKELAASAELGSCWSQPILSFSEQVLGTFAIYHHEPTVADEADIFLIKEFSQLASIAIEHNRAAEEKVLLELQLQHNQKLDSLGELSSGIAHDFNNILAVILGHCSLTKMNFENAQKHIPEIEKAAERAAVLCRQMMAYAGKAQLTITNVAMGDEVGDIVGMLKSTLPQNAVIKTDISANIPMIEGDVSQLQQVVMNLIINASEAIGTEQGEVAVSLTKQQVLAGKTYEDYNGKPIPSGEYVCLEVTDNGCGMDEATKWRLFEPFFTTKFTGRGLGMSAVLGIINSHRGALQLFSQPNHGTTFKVFLPALLNELIEEENKHLAIASEAWRGSGTILLVEDEDEVRFIAKELLEMFGFTVLEAVNGKQALEIYQKNATDVTLVFTDVGMPVMDGYELFKKLKKLKPKLSFIFASGYGDGEVKARIGSENIAGIVSKPYNPDKLREVLKSVVEGR